jgi:hypothetical protein
MRSNKNLLSKTLHNYLTLVLFIMLSSIGIFGCGGGSSPIVPGPSDPGPSDSGPSDPDPAVLLPEDDQRAPEAISGSESTLTQEDVVFEVADTGLVLDNDTFDLLETMPNPLTNEQWDAIFVDHSGASVDRTANADPAKYSWVWSSPTAQCAYEVTVAFTYRENQSTPGSENYDDGTYAYNIWSAGSAHYLRVDAVKYGVGVNCNDGPWDKTAIGYGLGIIEYRVAWRLVAGHCDFEAPILAEAEAYYKSHEWVDTWVGTWCPFGTRIANAYAVDQAQAVFNGTSLFERTAGAQSGDAVETSISFTLAGELAGGKESGAKASASISSSETRNKDEGSAEDYVNGFGKSSSTDSSGYIYVNAGGRAFARHDARAAASAEVTTQSWGEYLVVTVAGRSAGFYVTGGADSAQRTKDIDDLVRPFFEARGWTNVPPR